MKRLVPLFLALMLPACGLQPLYNGGPHGNAGAFLNQTDISAIEGKAGWLMRNALTQRMGKVQGQARFRLEVRLDDQISGFGVRRDDAVTRERRTLRARYKLVDQSNNQTVLDATAGSDVGIDVVTSEYAVVAAENSALERLAETVADQIVARIALATRQRK